MRSPHRTQDTSQSRRLSRSLVERHNPATVHAAPGRNPRSRTPPLERNPVVETLELEPPPELEPRLEPHSERAGLLEPPLEQPELGQPTLDQPPVLPETPEKPELEPLW